jgi:hypothetical protein
MTLKFEKFLNYYNRHERILNESPVRLGRQYSEELDNNWFNVETAKETLEDSSFEKVLSKEVFDVNLNLFRDVYEEDKFQDYWMTDQPFISCYFLFQKSGKGLQSLRVWNHKAFKGTAKDLFFSYYLQNFDFIISDNKHSDQGESYWKKIVKIARTNGNAVTVIARDGIESDLKNLDGLWGSSEEFSKFRIKVFKR